MHVDELVYSLLPNKMLPQWITELGKELFMSLEKDLAFLKSLGAFVENGQFEECDTRTYDRTLYERQYNLHDVRNGTCALAAFVLLHYLHYSDFSNPVQVFLSIGRVTLSDLFIIVYALDTMIERKPTIQTVNDRLVLDTEVFSFYTTDFALRNAS